VDQQIQLRSVNAGLPAHLGIHQGRPVQSAIHKRPATAPTLWLDTLNLEGDLQADLSVHGGPDKALYVYSADNLDAWTRELGGGPFSPGDIGENLTVAGLDETEVCIGDIWSWGDARIQVTQPREPCYKLALRTGRPEMTRLFEKSGRCGWYMRVLSPGRVPSRGPIHVEAHDPAALTVRGVQRLSRNGGGSTAAVRAAASHPALAAAWARALQRRLGDTDTPPL
jgi:MOSC domain-containing protein YiiM